jgi:Mannosylglycerate hydrolase MGH1-like glycoside hydrolase domain
MHWLRRRYPKVAAYMRWWLEHRTDDEGYLVYACSWESGQDVSSRFGPQQTGGTIIQHVRPVDLQASMVQGAEILARWAMLLLYDIPAQSDAGAAPLAKLALADGPPLDFAGEAAYWQKLADEFTMKTRFMWRDGWFRDYDSVAREWSSQRDVMHLAPVFCGASDASHVEQLRPYLSQPPSHSNGWAPLCWPPVVMTLIGAASAAKMPSDAAELAYQFIDASYRSIDSRAPDGESGLPGVTREYRRVVNINKKGVIEYANAGIEGYGWGALSVHLLMRYIMGLREEEVGTLLVAPVLPHALRHAGAVYRVGPVQWGKSALQVACTVRDAENYTMHLQSSTAVDEERLVSSVSEQQWQWDGSWGTEHRIKLS